MLVPNAVRLSATSVLRPSRLRFGWATPFSSIARMPSTKVSPTAWTVTYSIKRLKLPAW